MHGISLSFYKVFKVNWNFKVRETTITQIHLQQFSSRWRGAQTLLLLQTLTHLKEITFCLGYNKVVPSVTEHIFHVHSERTNCEEQISAAEASSVNSETSQQGTWIRSAPNSLETSVRSDSWQPVMYDSSLSWCSPEDDAPLFLSLLPSNHPVTQTTELTQKRNVKWIVFVQGSSQVRMFTLCGGRGARHLMKTELHSSEINTGQSKTYQLCLTEL